MPANFTLTLIAPKNYSLEKFGSDALIWSSTDADKTSVRRYMNDPTRDSVMEIQSVPWTLGDGKILENEMRLNSSILGAGEGAHKDFVVMPGIRYSFSCLYKVTNGVLTIQLYDQTNSIIVYSADKTDASWSSCEASIVIPAGCEIIRIKFLQSESGAKSGLFYIDNVSLNGNILLCDPDSYSRISERVGSLHQTLSGRRVFDLRAIHYSFHLGWNFFEEMQYENLREAHYSNEMLYFSDENVPALIESKEIHETAQHNYENTVNPSYIHKAYSDKSNLLPSSKDDFEATEFTTAEYEAIGRNDINSKDTANPGDEKYLYHKFLFLSSIYYSDVNRFKVSINMASSDSSPQNLDGGILYAWNGKNWVELAQNTNSAETILSYSTAETEIAKQFVDNNDNYIRLMLRSNNKQMGANSITLKTYYVECEINEGLDSTIELSHKAFLSELSDVLWVKNLSQGTQLQYPVEYTISNNGRSVTIGDAYAILDGMTTYFSAGDVLDGGTNDICISAWIKKDGASAWNAVIVEKYLSGIGYDLYIDTNGRLRGWFQDAGGYASGGGGANICDNKWHHIAIVFDRSGNMAIYVDGIPYGTVSDISSRNLSVDNAGDFTVGANSGGTQKFDGSIRNVRIWIGGVWSEPEILAQVSNPYDILAGGANTSSWTFSDSATATSIMDNTGINNLTLCGGNTTNYDTHSRATIASANDEVEVKYNRYFEVMFSSIPEEWFNGHPLNLDRPRSAEIVLQTLSESK